MSENPTPEEQRLPPAPAEDDKPFGIVDYLIVNVAFLVFLLLAHLLIRGLFPESGGVQFFFIVLAIGFVAVSIYDYIFDRLYRPEDETDGRGG